MLELKNIKKYYKMGDNVVKALDDVSLKIEDGEFVTIIGPSGSGKSTLMNIIGCLDIATSGQYFVDGVEISNFKENQLAFLRNKKMGFIFQGFNLLSNMSALENVELPLIYQGIKPGERRKRAIEALEAVGMRERMKHKPTELSGGQQQRVAIARALATKPMCILADEPTGNLDTATGDEIMKILHNLNDMGTTVVIITHNDEIAKEAKRVVRILDGKIHYDERQGEGLTGAGESGAGRDKEDVTYPSARSKVLADTLPQNREDLDKDGVTYPSARSKALADTLPQNREDLAGAEKGEDLGASKAGRKADSVTHPSRQGHHTPERIAEDLNKDVVTYPSARSQVLAATLPQNREDLAGAKKSGASGKSGKGETQSGKGGRKGRGKKSLAIGAKLDIDREVE